MWVSFDYRVLGALYLIHGIPLGDRYSYLFGQILVYDLAHTLDRPKQFIVTPILRITESPEVFQHCECDDPSFCLGRYSLRSAHVPLSAYNAGFGRRPVFSCVCCFPSSSVVNSYTAFVVGSNVRYSPSTPHSRIV